MELNDLLLGKRIDGRHAIVFRHRPSEPELNKVLPLLAADRPDLYNAYQQSHGEIVEKALQTSQHVISFIRYGSNRALFVGAYAVGKWKYLTERQFWRIPAHAELQKLGMSGSTRPRRLVFDLKPIDFYPEWKGKLIVDWPPPERSWWRRAHRNNMPIRAVLEDSALDAAMQSWNELDLTWSQLSILPKRWQAKLAEWRGIYYIFDRSNGKGYVGSAYGVQNLLGRWRNYGASGHGGNQLLRQRNPGNFRFTILELVSPTMPAEAVQRLESNWKERLHTRQPYGLNDN
jgi:hypothetical protein